MSAPDEDFTFRLVGGPRLYTVGNTMATLEVLVRVPPLTPPELARRLEIGDRSARGILYRLTNDGYVKRVRGDRTYHPRYKLAPAARELAQRIIAATDGDDGN